MVRHFNSRDFATALRGLGELLAETARSTQVLKRHLSGTLGDTKNTGDTGDTCQIYNVMLMFCLYLSYLLYLSSYQSGKILHEQAAFGCATAVMSALALAAQCCDHLQLPVLATRPETRSFPLEVWR